MKNILILTLLTTVCQAQTNLGLITFTNKSGVLVENAEVVKADASRIYYKLGSGGGSARLADLPPDLQTKFHFDSVASALAEMNADAAKKERARAVAAYAAAEAAMKEDKKANDKGSATVKIREIENNSVYTEYSYQIIIRNPTPTDFVRDYKINLLDKDGFVLETGNEYKVKTRAATTNTVRGTIMQSKSKPGKYVKPEIIASDRLK